MKSSASIWLRVVFATSALAGTAVSAPVWADGGGIAQCIAANDQGLDLRKQGHLIEARKALTRCASASCGAEISETCQKGISEINGLLPTIVFAPKDGGGNDLVAVKVAIDGIPYADKLEGSPIVLDPGEHEFRFEASGQPPLLKRFVLRQGEQNRREEIVIGAPAAPAGPVASTVALSNPPRLEGTSTATVPVATAEGGAPSSRGIGMRRIFGLVAGGAGLAGIAMGSIFGVMTGAASNQQKSDCPSSSNCPDYPKALSDHSTMVTDGAVSDVTFIAGGALLAAGVVLFVIGGDKSSDVPSARVALSPAVVPTGRGGVSLGLDGEF